MSNKEWLGLFWKDVFHKFQIKERGRLDFLRSTSFFKGCSDWEISLAQEFLHERHYNKGEYIFEIGQPGATLCFIFAGQVSIEVPGDKEESVQLATLGEGAFFGELALIDDSPRSASARAHTDCKILALPRSELDRMLKVRPVLGGLVYKALAQITGERLKATIDRIQAEERQIKLVSNG